MLLEGSTDWTSDRTRGNERVEYYDFFFPETGMKIIIWTEFL